VQEYGHRQPAVELVRGESEPRAIPEAEVDAAVQPVHARETTRGGDEDAARVHCDDAAPGPHETGKIAGEHAGASSYFEHAPPRPDSAEAQEALPQPDLAGRATSCLQKRHVLLGIGLLVDGTIRSGPAWHGILRLRR
jgi:hypothetical protein